MTRPAVTTDAVAIETGATSGISLATANRFAVLGLRVHLVDLEVPRFDPVQARLSIPGFAFPR